jgi:flagellar protein FlaG
MIEKLSNTNSPLVKQVEQVEIISKVKEVDTVTQDRPQQQTQSKEKTEKVINSMNEFLKDSNTHLKFSLHEELQEYYVAIVDDATNEVIREIPSKKLLDMYAAMTEYVGLLVDRKA